MSWKLIFLFWPCRLLLNLTIITLVSWILPAKTADKILRFFGQHVIFQIFCYNILLIEFFKWLIPSFKPIPPEKNKEPQIKVRSVFGIFVLCLFLILEWPLIVGYVLFRSLFLLTIGHEIFLTVFNSYFGCLLIFLLILSLHFKLPQIIYPLLLLMSLIGCTVIKCHLDQKPSDEYFEEFTRNFPR